MSEAGTWISNGCMLMAGGRRSAVRPSVRATRQRIAERGPAGSPSLPGRLAGVPDGAGDLLPRVPRRPRRLHRLILDRRQIALVLGDLPEDPERIGAPIVEHLFKLPEAVPAHRSSLTTAARRVNLG